MPTPTLNDAEFALLWNNSEAYPTLADIARKAGLARQTIKNMARNYRRRVEQGEKLPRLIDRTIAPSERSTLPELQHQYKDMGKPELIELLKEMWRASPDTPITRDRFRAHTGLADSTWNKHFGTFLEFRRQAGLEMNRNQHAVERQLAKHVSVDHYREFNDRSSFADRYLRNTDKKVKVIVGCSDLHDIEIDRFYLRTLIEGCRIVQPDIINLGGDIFDLPEFGKYSVDPREWDVVGRIKFVHEHILKPLREACPNAQIDFVEGNHEFRLLRHLADATPALKAVLSDLLSLTVPKLLGLDEFEVNYIARADLAAWSKHDQDKEVAKSYIIYDDAVLVHHHPHAKNWGLPGWNGHHHSWKVEHCKHALRGAYPWMQLGCGHALKAPYTEGEFWSMGFNICHVNTETKSVNMEYIQVTDMAVVGGVYFHRAPGE